MKTVFVVIEYGGEDDYKWDKIIGVCTTKELAEQLQEKSRKENSLPSPIPEFEALYDLYLDHEPKYPPNNYIDGMAEMFPQYSREQLEQADRAMFNYNDYIDTQIEEVKFYEHLS